MSILSAAWQRNKSAIAGLVRTVPVVGGVAGSIVERINTGDYVDPGSVGAVDPAIQRAIEEANAFNRAEADRLRQAAADSVARIGAGATLTAANAIGPPGNKYGRALDILRANPVYMFVVAAVVLFVVVSLARKRS